MDRQRLISVPQLLLGHRRYHITIKCYIGINRYNTDIMAHSLWDLRADNIVQSADLRHNSFNYLGLVREYQRHLYVVSIFFPHLSAVPDILIHSPGGIQRPCRIGSLCSFCGLHHRRSDQPNLCSPRGRISAAMVLLCRSVHLRGRDEYLGGEHK